MTQRLIHVIAPIADESIYESTKFLGPTHESEYLTNVGLNNSIIHKGKFLNAVCTQFSLDGSVVSGKLDQVHLDDWTLKNSSRMEDCVFNETTMNSCKLFESFVDRCAFSRSIILTNCIFTNVLFRRCNFEDVRFDDCFFTSCVFEDCVFSGEKIDTKNVRTGVAFNRCDLTSTKFKRCNFEVRRLISGLTSVLPDAKSTTSFNMCGLTSVTFAECKTAGLDKKGTMRCSFTKVAEEKKGADTSGVGRVNSNPLDPWDDEDDEYSYAYGYYGGFYALNGKSDSDGLGRLDSWSRGSRYKPPKKPEVKKYYPYRFVTAGI